MVKIHFLQKVLKKWSSFRKKNKKKFSITGGEGGGPGPYMEFSIIIFYFFFEPFPNLISYFFRQCWRIIHFYRSACFWQFFGCSHTKKFRKPKTKLLTKLQLYSKFKISKSKYSFQTIYQVSEKMSP